jgi:hypothetical protein
MNGRRGRGRWQRLRRSIGWFVAEMVVIVVGVLVAISIDAGFAEREDIRAERALLESLASEFGEAAALLEVQLGAYRKRTDAAEALIRDRAKLSGLPSDSIATLWQWATRGGSYDYPSGVLTSATSSGDLALVRDPRLRAALARWPSDVQDFTNIELKVEHLIFNQLLPSARADFDLPTPYGFGVPDRPTSISMDAVQSLSSRRYQNFFREEITWWRILDNTSPAPELEEIRSLIAGALDR